MNKALIAARRAAIQAAARLAVVAVVLKAKPIGPLARPRTTTSVGELAVTAAGLAAATATSSASP